MPEGFFTVTQNVSILFILISVGFLCGKTKLLDGQAVKGMTELVLCFSTPCVIISAFQTEFRSELLSGLCVTAVSAFLIILFSIILTRPFTARGNSSERTVIRFAVIFSNCGFMSLPLQNAVIGQTGVFYGSVYIAVFSLFIWSYGLITMSGEKSSFSLKKLLLNPGILGVAVALLMFLFSVRLPSFVIQPIDYLGALNTPLPMLIIGYHLSRPGITEHLKSVVIYIAAAIRLAVIPLVSLFVMMLCGIRGDVLIAITIATSAPSATITTLFATKFGRGESLSVSLVAITTLFSLISMPLIIALAFMLAK